MNTEYRLEVKTVRHSNYADEFEGREGLMKLPYKMLLQQSEIQNGQLRSEIDELKDLIRILRTKIRELKSDNKGLRQGLLKKYGKEVRREEMYQTLKNTISRQHETIHRLRQDNRELLSRILNQKDSELTLMVDYIKEEQI